MSIIFSNFLITKFIENPEDILNEKTRSQYGYLGGTVGIISNLILFLIKLIIGVMSSSISIIADAFNNFFDSTSSIITMIGFKLANRPPDKEHPFGHGRIEYLSALIVAFMVMMFGFEFLKTSFDRIFNPSIVKFETVSFLILIASILIKIWLSKFNFLLGDKINSSALKASALDAKGDVFTSSCVALSFLINQFISLPIDAYVGVIVSIGIIYSGFNLIKETISPLLGEAPSKELVDSVINGLLEYEEIIGVHDLIIHNYGTGRCLASVHAEMPANLGVMTMHEIADEAERNLSRNLNIHLVIHTDPICTDDKSVLKTKKEIEDIIYTNDTILSMHDFRIVGENSRKNLIFDIVVKPSEINTKDREIELINWVNESIRRSYPLYNCIITVDKDFN